MGWFSRKPKTPPAAPVMAKHNFRDFNWLSIDFDHDPEAQRRAKEYVHRQVSDFRTTKDTEARWRVQKVNDGEANLYMGRTLMLVIVPNDSLRGLMARAVSMGAPLMIEGRYVWDYKAGPFGARLYLPKDPATVEMLQVS